MAVTGTPYRPWPAKRRHWPADSCAGRKPNSTSEAGRQQRPVRPHGGQLGVAVAEQVGNAATVQHPPPLLRRVQVRVAVEVEHAHLTAGPFLPAEPGHGAQHQRAVTAEQNRDVTVGPRGRDGISDPADHIQDGRQIPGA
jgi:hypothetical protein